MKESRSTDFNVWHLCAFLGGALFLWCLNWGLLVCFEPSSEIRGQFGDMFGGLNALFTAFAFAALVYTTFLQRKELREQREAQEELTREQQAFQEEQHRKQSDLYRDIEASRQAFLKESEDLRRQHEHRARKEFSTNVLLAIRSEIEALGAIYSAGGMGKFVAELREGQVLNVRFTLSQSFFTVFEANAVNLGRVPPDLAKQIVSIYGVTKLLIEEFRINNKYLDERERLFSVAAEGSQINPVQRRLTEQARKILSLNKLLSEMTERLLKALPTSHESA